MRNDGYCDENESKADSEIYCDVRYISNTNINNISFKHIINNIDYIVFDMSNNDFLNYYNGLNVKDKERLKKQLKFSVTSEVTENRRKLRKLI
jgi:hypothetical protein